MHYSLNSDTYQKMVCNKYGDSALSYPRYYCLNGIILAPENPTTSNRLRVIPDVSLEIFNLAHYDRKKNITY